MMRRWILPAGCLLLVLCGSSHAQARRNFYSRYEPIVYLPVVDIVTSGAQMMVRPTVSADRKYVTLGGTVQNSQVVRIQNFAVEQVGAMGNVGGAIPAPIPAGGAPDPNASAPVRVGAARGGMILNQPGMTRVE